MSRRLKFFALLCLLSTLSPLAVAADKSAGDNPCASQITYQSDKDDAYKYLENLQRQIYTENPQLTDPYSREVNKPRYEASFAELKARAIKACPDPSKRAPCALDLDVVVVAIQSAASVREPCGFETVIKPHARQCHFNDLLICLSGGFWNKHQ
jgi:hypothetical protein